MHSYEASTAGTAQLVPVLVSIPLIGVVPATARARNVVRMTVDVIVRSSALRRRIATYCLHVQPAGDALYSLFRATQDR